MSAKFAEINLRIYGPQVVTAARTLAAHPGSAAARENLDVFVDMWAWLLADAARLARELLDLTHDRPDKQQYSSLPRPGVSAHPLNEHSHLIPAGAAILCSECNCMHSQCRYQIRTKKYPDTTQTLT